MTVSGYCRSDLAPLRAAFESLHAEGLELGSAVAVTMDGVTVAHLWDGWRDKARTQSWQADTLVPVYSSGKAIVALMMAILVSDGVVDYETPIGDLWPAFATQGREALTVAQALSHQSGVPGFREPFDPTDWYDWDAIIAKLATEVPFWQPGTASGYHPVSFGFLAGKIAQTATERTLGALVHERLCNSLDLDLWFGLPPEHEARVADLVRPTTAPDLGEITPERRAAFLEKWSAPAGRGGDVWRAANLPAVNLHTTAESLARAYAVVACGGAVDGCHLLSTDALDGLMRERISGPDRVLPYTLSWGAGVLRNNLGIYGPNPQTVGHSGWGGSCVFADPDMRLSFAYVMNKQSNRLLGDERPKVLIEALYSAL